jgi:DNA-binding transcriptional LysR family regulator
VTNNNQQTIRELRVAGCGVSFLVRPEIAGELADGRLVGVLRVWSLPRLSVDALMLPRSTQPAKVRAAIERLGTALNATRTG